MTARVAGDENGFRQETIHRQERQARRPPPPNSGEPSTGQAVVA